MKCRHCNQNLKHVFADLDFAPISNDMLKSEDLNKPETYYPLKVFVCDNCFLVQLDEFKNRNQIFHENYTYFSSVSETWLKHTRDYVDMMMQRFNLNNKSKVMEIASNDGCLLENFLNYEVEVLGIEPTPNTAASAEKRGVKTIVKFFSSSLAKKMLLENIFIPDLIIGNNVLAHVPDIDDFVEGMKTILNKNGVITMEFPHLLNLIKEYQFDTIYHEHYSYLSLLTVRSIFEQKGLNIFDVEKLSTHGGSLRIYAKHKENKALNVSKNVDVILDEELKCNLNKIECYQGFQKHINEIKYDSLSFLINERNKGKKIIGYGAASKGNTFLNYLGLKGNDILEFVVDASIYKQGKYLPGSHIPVKDLSSINEFKPDFVVILPWNLKNEIMDQLSYIKDWGGKFIIFVPKLKIYS